jgi:hypothetical protein
MWEGGGLERTEMDVACSARDLTAERNVQAFLFRSTNLLSSLFLLLTAIVKISLLPYVTDFTSRI